MDHPFFSVIMPVHNSADYMRRALDSIKEQTFTDYELIVVADACEDNSADIAREYGAKVIEVNYHTDGLSRNAALDIATGEWILFIDSDDWFLHEFVFKQISEMVGRHDEDILLCSFIWKGVGYASQSEHQHYIAIWNKVWRRSFIGDTRFPEKRYWNDVEFDRDNFRKNPKCVIWDMPIYYYNYLHEGSNSWLQKQGIIE